MIRASHRGRRTTPQRWFRPGLEALEERTVPSFLPGNELPVSQASASAGSGTTHAAVASAPDGRFVVTYTPQDASGASKGVFARVFKADGTPLTDEFAVSSVQGAGPPGVAIDAAGDFVITWQEGANVIAARQFTAAGQPVGNEFVVYQSTGGSELSPSVGNDASGNFVISWASSDIGTQGSIAARRYTANGTPLAAVFQVSPDDASGTSRFLTPRVAMNSTGVFAIAWEHSLQNGSTTTQTVEAQLFNALGTPLNNRIVVSQYVASTDLAPPGIAMDAAGEFVVTWESWAFLPGTSDYASQIYAQRYSAAGQAQGAAFVVDQYQRAIHVFPVVAMDSAGDFAITWTSFALSSNPFTDDNTDSNSEDGSGGGVFARLFDSSGQDLYSEFQVNQTTLNNQAYSSVAEDSAGDVVFAWQSRVVRNSGVNGWTIDARQYTAGTVGYAWDPMSQALVLTAPASGLTSFQFDYAYSIIGGTNGLIGSARSAFMLNGVLQIHESLANPLKARVNAPGNGNVALISTNNSPVQAGALTLGPSGGSLGTAALDVLDFSGFATVYGYMGRGDTGVLNATPGEQNTFVSAGTYSYLTNLNSFYLISGASHVYSYAAGPRDAAYHYDGSGPDAVGHSTLFMSGTDYSWIGGVENNIDFFNSANGYHTNVAIAFHPNQDTAYFVDSPGNDVFASYTNYSYMYSANPDGSLAEFDAALGGFAQIFAASYVGGIDYAYNFNTPGHVLITGFIMLR
jgi:hypothetical protein